MRPWIAVAYSAPVAAATAVFIIYPIGQGSFSDGILCLIFAYFITLVQEQATLTNLKFKVLMSLKGTSKTCLDGENPTNQIFTIEEKESSSRVLFSSGQPRAKDYSTNHSSGSLHDLQHRK